MSAPTAQSVPARRPLPLGNWGIIATGLASLVGVALMFTVPVFATSVPATLGLGPDRGGVLVEKLVWLLPVFVLVLIFTWRAPGIRALATRAPNRALVWGAALAFSIAFYLLVRLVQGPDSGTADSMRDMGFFSSTTKDILQILAIGCVGPVAEEFVFRGLLYRSIRDFVIGLVERLGSRAELANWVAIAVALAVSGYGFIQIHTGSPGLYLVMASGYALLYQLTGSLQSAAFAHALNNSAVMFIAAWSGPGFSPAAYATAIASPFLALALTRLVGLAVRDDRPEVNAMDQASTA